MNTFVKPVKPLKHITYFRNLKGIPTNRLNKPLLRSLNFKHAKCIDIEFNPFDPKSHSIRHFSNIISVPKWTQTNTGLIIKNNVVTGSSEPRIYVTFNTGCDLEIKTMNLDCVEICKILRAHYNTYFEKIDSANTVEVE